MVGGGGFLAGCQLPAAAALQHVNMSVARETGRARAAARCPETPVDSVGFQTLGKKFRH